MSWWYRDIQMNSVDPDLRTTRHHLSLLRGRLRRARHAGRNRRRGDIAGDPKHPANLGRLCSKGSALGETLGS